jgi:hypothetical protein
MLNPAVKMEYHREAPRPARSDQGRSDFGGLAQDPEEPHHDFGF